jgi:hypothetical protein
MDGRDKPDHDETGRQVNEPRQILVGRDHSLRRILSMALPFASSSMSLSR